MKISINKIFECVLCCTLLIILTFFEDVEAASITVLSAPSTLVPALDWVGVVLLLIIMSFLVARKRPNRDVSFVFPFLFVLFTTLAYAVTTQQRNPFGDYINTLTSVGNPTGYTLETIPPLGVSGTATTYTPTSDGNGGFIFTSIPAGTYYLIATLDGQTPKLVIPVSTATDSMTVKVRCHSDSRDIDGDGDTSEYALSGYIGFGADFSNGGNRWVSSGTSTSPVQKIHVCGSSVNLPSGITITGTATAGYTYFDNDNDLVFGESSSDNASTIDLDDDMSEFETVLNIDVDGDGSVENVDEDIDNDGIVNASDDDIDGDGLKNSSDNDANGDGIID